jgi:AraC-like DNA-binding protein
MYLYNKNRQVVFSVFDFQNISFWNQFTTTNFYAIILIDSGLGEISIDNQIRNLSKLDIVFFYPYQKINWKSNSESELKGVCVQFHPDFFCIDIHANDIGCQGLLFNNPFYNTICKFEESDFLILQNHVNQMKTEVDNPTIASLDMISSLLRIILINSVRLKLKNEVEIDKIALPEMAKKIERLIDQNIFSNYKSEFYANHLNISVSTLNRYCKTYFGQSFQKILANKLIAQAKSKLFITDWSIKKISLVLGFEDQLYFSRFFKKHTGVSPIDFRKNLKEVYLQKLSI